ncbi:MAG: HAD-IA family hydrolase [Deinococcota bacterium]
MQALLFGSIGTLVETSELQRQAFNQAFEDASVGWHWSKQAYQDMLTISGGQNRLRYYAKQRNQPLGEADIRELHQRKSKHFQDVLNAGIELRPGVSRLIAEAREHGVKLGFVSTTSRANIEAIAAGVDALSLTDFDVVTSADNVSESKPHPQVYQYACQTLGVRPEYAVAIEDTAVSLQAARAANIICIATPGDYTSEQDFSEAQAVFEQLGTDNKPGNVIRTEFAFEQTYVDINWLSKLLQKSQGIFA